MNIRLIILTIFILSGQSGYTQLNELTKKQVVYELSFNKKNDTIRTLYSETEFDELGRKLRETFYEDDKMTLSTFYYYDSNNRLIKDSTILLDIGNVWDTSITYCIYDKHGRLKLEENKEGKFTKYKYQGKDTLIWKELRSNGIEAQYYYDSLSHTTKMIYRKNGKEYYWIEYDYNGKGQQIHYTTSSYPNWHNYNLFDGEGNHVEFLRFDNDGNLTQRIRYNYNDQNKLVKKEEFDEENNRPNFVYEVEYQ